MLREIRATPTYYGSPLPLGTTTNDRTTTPPAPYTPASSPDVLPAPKTPPTTFSPGLSPYVMPPTTGPHRLLGILQPETAAPPAGYPPTGTPPTTPAPATPTPWTAAPETAAPETPAPKADAPQTTASESYCVPATPGSMLSGLLPPTSQPMGFTMHFHVGGNFDAAFEMNVTQGQAKQKASPAKKRKVDAAKPQPRLMNHRQ